MAMTYRECIEAADMRQFDKRLDEHWPRFLAARKGKGLPHVDKDDWKRWMFDRAQSFGAYCNQLSNAEQTQLDTSHAYRTEVRKRWASEGHDTPAPWESLRRFDDFGPMPEPDWMHD